VLADGRAPLAAGRVSRPVFSVVSAIFRPMPGVPMMFSAGTFTSVKRSRPFFKPFRPMNLQLCSTVNPGVPFSTMKAVICLRSLPSFTTGGVCAMTTRMSATGPLLHHIFRPFIT
jgi:hypothetical protein